MCDVMEDMMSHFGDSILRLMHKQNWPSRVSGSSTTFFEFIMQTQDEECKNLQKDICAFMLQRLAEGRRRPEGDHVASKSEAKPSDEEEEKHPHTEIAKSPPPPAKRISRTHIMHASEPICRPEELMKKLPNGFGALACYRMHQTDCCPSSYKEFALVQDWEAGRKWMRGCEKRPVVGDFDGGAVDLDRVFGDLNADSEKRSAGS